MYTYSSTGTYTVNLTAVNLNGTNSKLATIAVSEEILPVANFTSNVTSGSAPLTVQFNDSSLNATEVRWDFDNSGVTDSTDRNPMYTYSSTGTYTVNLTAVNLNGTNSKLATITVSIKPPVASFSASKTSGRAPLIVIFSDRSTGTISSRIWDFGDGKTSTSKTVLHMYTKNGTYTCKLTVSNSGGNSSISKTITVN
jgi:PKD repeat protein